MGLLFLRFWPVLLPLVVYWLWWLEVGARAQREGREKLRFRDGPWYWAMIVSLFVGVACFLILGASEESKKGHYIPPHLEEGKLIPGTVEP